MGASLYTKHNEMLVLSITCLLLPGSRNEIAHNLNTSGGLHCMEYSR